jgi:hypothetical protein
LTLVIFKRFIKKRWCHFLAPPWKMLWHILSITI